jgi:phospholipid transport system substrate-binding protein
MSMMNLLFIILISLTPLETIKEKNSLLEEAAKNNSNEMAEKIIEEMIDFDEMARNALGKNASKFTLLQRGRFFKLFKELLKKSSIKKISSYQADRIDFLREEEKDGKALVFTAVYKGKEKTDVVYVMKKKGEDWKAVDIIINETSITKNFNSQYTSIINKEGVEGLLKKMERKLKEE